MTYTPTHSFDATYLPSVDAVLPSIERFDSLPDEGDLDVIYTKDNRFPKMAYIGNIANEVI